MSYTPINWSAVDSFDDWLSLANDQTSGAFWSACLYLIVLVLLLALINFGWETGIIVSLFIGIMLGVLLLYLGLIPLWVLGTLIGFLLFLVLYLVFSKK